MKLSNFLVFASLSAISAAESCSYKTDKYGTVKGTCGKPSKCRDTLGYIVDDLCSGGEDNKCCIDKGCITPAGTEGFCTRTSWCDSLGSNYRRIANKCPGPDNVQCCYYMRRKEIP